MGNYLKNADGEWDWQRIDTLVFMIFTVAAAVIFGLFYFSKKGAAALEPFFIFSLIALAASALFMLLYQRGWELFFGIIIHGSFCWMTIPLLDVLNNYFMIDSYPPSDGGFIPGPAFGESLTIGIFLLLFLPAYWFAVMILFVIRQYRRKRGVDYGEGNVLSMFCGSVQDTLSSEDDAV